MNASARSLISSSRPSQAHTLRWLNGILPAMLLLAPAGAPLAQTDAPDRTTRTVEIRARQFQPDRIVLPYGHRTVLTLKNQDSELHAFVPSDLFAGESLNVAGNGAPEFGPHGLKRVIIPSEGVVEIRFVPSRPGEYPYRCDMPGHEMSGVIVVE